MGQDFSFAEYNKIDSIVHLLPNSVVPSASPRRSFYQAFCETKYLGALVRAAIARKRERTGGPRIDSRRMAAGAPQPWHSSEKFFAIRCTRFTACVLAPGPRLFALERLIFPLMKRLRGNIIMISRIFSADPSLVESISADSNICDLRTKPIGYSYVLFAIPFIVR